MSSRCATIEVYPDYKEDGSVDYRLPFSFGCPEFGLMGYGDIEDLILKIRYKLIITVSTMEKERKEELNREHLEGQQDKLCECGNIIEQFDEGDDTMDLCGDCK